jgi:Arc/MetJ-type ribon-helix-helix transcriptional regulator
MGRPKTMASRKPVSLPPELAQAVEDFRFANRFKTESDAIRRLIELGLDAAGAKGAKPKGKR